MKTSSLRRRLIQSLILTVAFPLTSAGQEISPLKNETGLYFVVNFVHQEAKAKFDGYYPVTKEGTISFPSMAALVALDRDIELVRKELLRAVVNYCRANHPDWPLYPDIEIIARSTVAKAGKDVFVMGQVRTIKVVPMKDATTLWEAVQAADGATEFSDMKRVVVIRGEAMEHHSLIDPRSMRALLQPGDLIYVPRKCGAPETIYSTG